MYDPMQHLYMYIMSMLRMHCDNIGVPLYVHLALLLLLVPVSLQPYAKPMTFPSSSAILFVKC